MPSVVPAESVEQLTQPLESPSATVAAEETPPTSVPEPVYVYEIAAEETGYPEADFVVSYDEAGEASVKLDSIPVTEPLADQALPFEVRPKTPLAATASAVAEPVEEAHSGDAPASGNGWKAEPPA
jgi:hypothetical protein